MSENVTFKHPKGINEIKALNTTDRVAVSPACRNDDVNGTRAPAGGHTANSSADPKYEHWCRPEPTREFPFENAEADRYRERRGGMQDDTDLPRASNGGVIGAQVGVRVPKGSPHFQNTQWGEYNDIDQWNKEQAHTYDGERDEKDVDE